MTPLQTRASQQLCKHIFPNDHKAQAWRWIKCEGCGIEMGQVVSQEDWDKLKGEVRWTIQI